MEDRYYGYIHINKINAKYYVGITKNKPEKRWGKNGCNYSREYKFGKAIDKYGWDNFEHIEVISGMTLEEACQWEIDTIQKYDSFVNGYNSTLGGMGTAGVIASAKAVARISAKDITDIVIYSSLAEAERDTNVCAQNIGAVCLGYGLTAGEYYWCYEQDLSNWQIPKSPKERAVYCIELDKLYPSISFAAKELNISYSGIWKCCNGISLACGSNKYHFCYAEDYSEDWTPRLPRQIGRYNKRPVVCVETQEVFESVEIASLYAGICSQNMSQLCCKAHKPGGVDKKHYAYLDEYDEYWEVAPEYDTARRKEASTLKKEVYCLQTNKFYSSATEAGEATGVEVRYVCKCCSGELIETHGHNYCWKEDWYEGWRPRKSKRGAKQSRKVRNIDTNEIFESVAAAKKVYKGDIYGCCSGRQKTAGGYRWEYVTEE